jgi:unsaturated rhamnogalacturonyl hydrolase
MIRKRFIILLIMLSACNFQAQNKKNKAENLKWSVRMANSVINRSDSLIYYVDRNPKWAYDVAFLGMAVDRLGNIDPKYSKYMEDWVEYFVRPDGSIIDYRNEEYNLDRIFPGRNVMTLYQRTHEIRSKNKIRRVLA